MFPSGDFRSRDFRDTDGLGVKVVSRPSRKTYLRKLPEMPVIPVSLIRGFTFPRKGRRPQYDDDFLGRYPPGGLKGIFPSVDVVERMTQENHIKRRIGDMSQITSVPHVKLNARKKTSAGFNRFRREVDARISNIRASFLDKIFVFNPATAAHIKKRYAAVEMPSQPPP